LDRPLACTMDGCWSVMGGSVQDAAMVQVAATKGQRERQGSHVARSHRVLYGV